MSVKLPPKGTKGSRFPNNPLTRAGLAANVALYRLLRGKGLGKMLVLHTVGARTGKNRATPLYAFAEGDGWLVVGSAGGAAHNPAWVRNLAAHPDQVFVEHGGRRVKVRPRSLHGAERDRHWARIVKEAANFGSYQAGTDREIPVVELKPE